MSPTPTSTADFQKQMYEMLEQINKECAIIIVSHDVAEVLNNVKHIACVNHHLHYHDTADMPREKLEEHFLMFRSCIS